MAKRKTKAEPFRGGWPRPSRKGGFELSNGTLHEDLEEATQAQDELGWPRPFPTGGFVTSDRRRYSQEKAANAAQKRIDKDGD